MTTSFAWLLRSVIPALAVLFFVGCNTYEDSPYDTAPDTISPQRMLDLVNDVRTSGCDCGSDYFPPVDPVRWDSRLEEAAYNHSVWMEQNRNLSHTETGGSNAGDRIDATGYNWQAFGENIAEGYSTEEAVMDAWLRSPGHCENIMNPDFFEMGAAVSGGYWTQVFAQPF